MKSKLNRVGLAVAIAVAITFIAAAGSTAVAQGRFPIVGDQYDHFQPARHMTTNIKVSANGRLDATTTVRSTWWLRGFSSGVVILLLDQHGNIVHSTEPRMMGVDSFFGGQRTDHYFSIIPQDVLAQVHSYSVIHALTPRGRFLVWVKEVLAVTRSFFPFLNMAQKSAHREGDEVRANQKPFRSYTVPGGWSGRQ